LRKTEKGRRNLERYRKGKNREEKKGNSKHKEIMKNISNKRKNGTEVGKEGIGN
jgi:hypothetical protein